MEITRKYQLYIFVIIHKSYIGGSVYIKIETVAQVYLYEIVANYYKVKIMK